MLILMEKSRVTESLTNMFPSFFHLFQIINSLTIFPQQHCASFAAQPQKAVIPKALSLCSPDTSVIFKWKGKQD